MAGSPLAGVEGEAGEGPWLPKARGAWKPACFLQTWTREVGVGVGEMGEPLRQPLSAPSASSPCRSVR